MDSFDELGVTPELVDALTAEGIERPTEFQAAAIPVLVRGNPVLAQAGPGAGTLIAYGVPLLQRLDAEVNQPKALVLSPSVDGASRSAASLARLALVTGHRIGALDAGWALPENSAILFGTPVDVMQAVRASRISLEAIESVVVDGFQAMKGSALEALENLFESLDKSAQKVLIGQPLSDAAERFGKAHLSRAVHIPPKAAQAEGESAPPKRGEVFYRVTSEGKEQELLQTVAGALEGGAHHALLFFRTEDQAADVGDFLTLHGYASGPAGDPDAPVWLATEELPARKILDGTPDTAPVVPVSVDVPTGPDSLDRRHGGGGQGVILVRSRELPHLRHVARRTGYRLVPAKEPVPTRVAGEMEGLQALLRRALRDMELAPYFTALEPIFQEYTPAEVAAASLALLQGRQVAQRPKASDEPASAPSDLSAGPPPKTWARLFVAVGEKDGVGPGDLLGAIAGEAGVEGSLVGKIEIKDTYSLVEVIPDVADKIIKRLNGTSIRGRAVRVDHDRGSPRGRPAPSGGKPRRKLKGDFRPGS
jgi:ATP-dependent RNA helicase DeaD